MLRVLHKDACKLNYDRRKSRGSLNFIIIYCLRMINDFEFHLSPFSLSQVANMVLKKKTHLYSAGKDNKLTKFGKLVSVVLYLKGLRLTVRCYNQRNSNMSNGRTPHQQISKKPKYP